MNKAIYTTCPHCGYHQVIAVLMEDSQVTKIELFELEGKYGCDNCGIPFFANINVATKSNT